MNEIKVSPVETRPPLWRRSTGKPAVHLRQDRRFRHDPGGQERPSSCRPRAEAVCAMRPTPWQRPGNEKTNGLLRRYFPKAPTRSAGARGDILAIATPLNVRPRKSIGWRTPAEADQERLPVVTQARRLARLGFRTPARGPTPVRAPGCGRDAPQCLSEQCSVSALRARGCRWSYRHLTSAVRPMAVAAVQLGDP